MVAAIAIMPLKALLEQPGSWLAWRADSQQSWQLLFLDEPGGVGLRRRSAERHEARVYTPAKQGLDPKNPTCMITIPRCHTKF